MFNKYQIYKKEEEKMENSHPKKRKTRNFDFFNNYKSSKNKETKFKPNSTRKNKTITEIGNNCDKNKNPFFNKNSKDKNINKFRNNKKEININKDDLYNAFIYFQQLLINNEDENINEENIKDKLFNFILEKKNNFNEKKKNKFNNNIYEANKTILNSNKNRNKFTKTFYNDKIIQNSIEKKTNANSFSCINFWKTKNFINLIDENIKDTPRSVSQIIEEYLLTNNKIKERTNSGGCSRFSNYGYSFDGKNNEKSNVSFKQTPEKEELNDKFFDFNNNLFNDNYNSDEKENENEKMFITNSEKKLKNNLNNLNITEDLLIMPKFRKNEKLELMESNLNEEKCKNENFNNNYLFKNKIAISPTKINEESYIENKNFKKKSRESIIEPEKTNINEIKVNKSKILCNKENLISEKIKELDEEIKFFNEERQKVLKIKDEYEELKMKLLKEQKELNLKMQIQNKYFGNNNERVKLNPKTDTNFIMNITQHNHSLIINNYKKTETINLLKKRIYQLENIIKNKNKNEQENKKLHKNIIKNIRENNIYIFTKKKNDFKKKSNEDSLLKRKKVNLKMNIDACSFEKIKESNKNNIINQKNKTNQIINKKCLNSNSKTKNNLSTTKTLNINNYINNTKKINEEDSYGYRLKTIASFSKKYNHNFKTNENKSRINKNNKIEHSKLYIYEKLIKNEREREKNKEKMNIKENKCNKIKYNINSVRNFGESKKIMKRMKTEFGTNNKKLRERYKRTIINNNFNESKNSINNHQKSQGKNHVLKKINEENMNKNSSINLGINNSKQKNNKIKNIISQERNIVNYEKILSLDNINEKKNESNYPENDIINKINNKNKSSFNNNFEDDDNTEGYDFVIPEKYKSKNNEKKINTIKSDGKIINIYDNNKKEIIFNSGVKKEVFSDGYQLIYFPNGDMKQKFPGKEGKIMYFYKETNTVETTYKKGLNIFKFNNGQLEKHYPDGSKYIFYTNGLRRKISKNGTEEIFNPEELEKSEEKKNKNLMLDDN